VGAQALPEKVITQQKGVYAALLQSLGQVSIEDDFGGIIVVDKVHRYGY
jgi:hypothetical protein